MSGNVLYRWTPDSRRILFPQDENGNEKWNLHVVDVVSGEERNVTPLPGVQVTFLIFSDRDPNLAAIAVRDRHPMLPDLYRLSLTTGERSLILRNDRMVAVIPDHSLRPRVGIAIAPDGTIDLYKPTAAGDWAMLWDIGPADVAAVNATAYVQYTLSDAPVTYVLYDRPTGRTTRLFTGTPALEGLRLSKLHPFEITTTDGMKFVSYYCCRPLPIPTATARRHRPRPPWYWCTGGRATSGRSGPSGRSCIGWRIAGTRCSTSTTAARRGSESG